MSTIESLRDATAAAQAGEEVGAYRRHRGDRPAVPVVVTRWGTQIPHEPIPTRIRPSTIQTTWVDLGFTTRLQRTLQSAWDRIESTVALAQATGSTSVRATAWARGFESSEITGDVSILSPLDRAKFEMTHVGSIRRLSSRRPRIEIGRADNVSPTTDLAKSGPPKHSGYESVEWLKSFLGVSRENALNLGRIPSATFYAWQANPGAGVRPKTIAHLLRVVASLRLLESAVGGDRARTFLNSGSPTLLDNLADPSTTESALRRLSKLSRPAIDLAPERVNDARTLLEQLRALDRDAVERPDEAPLAGAEQMDVAEAANLRDEVDSGS